MLPILNHSLQARYSGSYSVINDVDYNIHTPDTRKSQQLCPINMLKPYVERDKPEQRSCLLPVLVETTQVNKESSEQDRVTSGCMKLKNSDILANLGDNLQHLSLSEPKQFGALIVEFADLFPKNNLGVS